MITHTPDEREPPAERGLVLAGYVEAGAPATLHPVYLRPEHWPERRQIVLLLNGRPRVLSSPPAAAPA